LTQQLQFPFTGPPALITRRRCRWPTELAHLAQLHADERWRTEQRHAAAIERLGGELQDMRARISDLERFVGAADLRRAPVSRVALRAFPR